MEIKKLVREDVGRLYGIFEVLNSLSPSPSVSDLRLIQFLEKMEKCDIHIFVAVESKKIIGTTSIIIEPKLIRGCSLVGRIEDVVVLPEYQGKGIASQLLEKASNYAKERNCYKVQLTCANDMEDFYSKNNFKRRGITMRKDF